MVMRGAGGVRLGGWGRRRSLTGIAALRRGTGVGILIHPIGERSPVSPRLAPEGFGWQRSFSAFGGDLWDARLKDAVGRDRRIVDDYKELREHYGMFFYLHVHLSLSRFPMS